VNSLDLRSLGQLSPLVSDYLDGENVDLLEPLRFLAPGESPGGPGPRVEREALARALGAANEGYGHVAAGEMAARLADPETLVVVTGQQPGFLGGPLYTLSKAIAAMRWAERLTREGRSAVALFWVATEDHDFAEVARASMPGPAGLESWALEDDGQTLAPVGLRSLGESVEGLMASWREKGSENHQAWVDQVRAWCRPEWSFGESFSRLMAGILGERCPLLVDAMLPELKQAQRAGLDRVVEERVAVGESHLVADAAIKDRGFDLQVRPQPGMSPLFLLHEGRRRRIEWRGDAGYALRGLDGFEDEVSSLRDIIASDPGRVSPGVFARPAFQDLALGSYLQILGPGELAYMAQVAPAYRLLGIEAPWVSLRPQVLVLSGRQADQAEGLGLAIEDLVAGKVDVEAVVADREGEDLVGPVRERVDRELAALRGPIEDLDPGLAKPFEKTAAQIDRSLDMLAGRARAASARHHEVATRRVRTLVEWVRPGGKLQERAVSSAYFPGRFDGFVEALFEQMDLDPRQLHLIDPERRS
jgi:bacillithiol biosynthesis cysteine-adding enzyme BshC